MSVRGSAAPPEPRTRLLSAIDAWLADGELPVARPSHASKAFS